MRYNFGQTVELTFTVTPDEVPTLTVTAPEGTVSTPTVTGTAAGTYAALVDAAQIGRWTYVWSTPNGGDQVGTFEVGRASSYATPQDVAAGFRPLTDPEALIVPTLLERAEAILLATVPSVPARIDSGTLSKGVVVAVEAAMVERVLRNPGGRRQESRTLGDFTDSWTIDDAVSSGALSVSGAEVALLAPAPPRPFAGSL